MCEIYQGWANYQTWALKLWIDNEQASQEYWLEQAKEAKQKERIQEYRREKYGPHGDYFSDGEVSGFLLADILKDEFQEAMPKVEGVWSDLLSSAFDRIDWLEIAKNLLED